MAAKLIGSGLFNSSDDDQCEVEEHLTWLVALGECVKVAAEVKKKVPDCGITIPPNPVCCCWCGKRIFRKQEVHLDQS